MGSNLRLRATYRGAGNCATSPHRAADKTGTGAKPKGAAAKPRWIGAKPKGAGAKPQRERPRGGHLKKVTAPGVQVRKGRG